MNLRIGIELRRLLFEDQIGAHAALRKSLDAVQIVGAIGVRVEVARARVAHVFKKLDEEERGLRGSRAFAQMLMDEKRVVHSVHTIDQMGWDQDDDRAIELELPYDGALDLYKKADDALNVKIPILTTTESGSDHSAFRRLGFKAVGITEEYRNKDTTPFIHRPGDTYELAIPEILNGSIEGGNEALDSDNGI